MADGRITLRRETVEALADALECLYPTTPTRDEATERTWARESARKFLPPAWRALREDLRAQDAGERFYPETPTPAEPSESSTFAALRLYMKHNVNGQPCGCAGCSDIRHAMMAWRGRAETPKPQTLL